MASVNPITAQRMGLKPQAMPLGTDRAHAHQARQKRASITAGAPAPPSGPTTSGDGMTSSTVMNAPTIQAGSNRARRANASRRTAVR